MQGLLQTPADINQVSHQHTKKLHKKTPKLHGQSFFFTLHQHTRVRTLVSYKLTSRIRNGLDVY